MEQSNPSARSARLKVGNDATQKTIEVMDGDKVVDRGVMISSSETGMAIMKVGGTGSVREVSGRLELVTRGGSIPVEVEREKASA